ncbi:hypothetical protein NDU88_001109 [Pleurodeles waltl]|uniref:Uncharacterized protein n=1 Tax=Pleurodeles waltl TaxID=8319 RepID=A0AAV7M032_PLEWA|nr:hypothetical protein NDU88_001109 [Pleurodeles waltl]
MDYNNTSKRQKKDPSSPTKSPLPLTLEDLMDERKHLMPFVMETNATLQRIEEKWSSLESRVSEAEQRISNMKDEIPHASFVSLNPICVPFLCHVPDPLSSYVFSCR